MKQRGKGFLSNIAYFGLSDVISNIATIISTICATWLLSASDFGSLALLSAYWGMLYYVRFFGVESSLSTVLAGKGDFKSQKDVCITASLIAVVAIIITITLLIALCLGSSYVASYFSASSIVLVFFLINAMLISMVDWVLYVLRFLKYARTFSIINSIHRVLLCGIPILAIFIYSHDRNLQSYLYFQILVNVAVCVWIYIKLRSLQLNLFQANLFYKNDAKILLSIGLMFIPSNFIFSSVPSISKIIIGNYTDATNVGVFSLAMGISAMFMMPKGWFMLAWYPQLVSWIATEDRSILNKRLQECVTIISRVLLAIVCLSIIWTKIIVGAVFSSDYLPAVPIVPVLTAAGGMSALSVVVVATAIQAGTAKPYLPVYAIGLVVSIIIQLIRVDSSPCISAAWGLIANELVIFLSWIYIGRFLYRNFKFRIQESLTLILIIIVFLKLSILYRIEFSLLNAIFVSMFILCTSTMLLYFSTKRFKAIS